MIGIHARTASIILVFAPSTNFARLGWAYGLEPGAFDLNRNNVTVCNSIKRTSTFPEFSDALHDIVRNFLAPLYWLKL